MRADLLNAPVDGLDEALAAVAGFDRVLVAGLLRPQAAQAEALAALADAVAGSPIGDRVAEAADKVAAGAVSEDHLAALAAARAALLGAAHDALAARIDEATGRPRAPWTPPPAAEPYAPNLRAAARSWLADIAVAGWSGLDHELVSGVAPAIAAMLADVRLRRLAALLDGFAAELAACCPGATVERFPERRWGDLWSRATLLAQPGAGDPPATGVATGRLLPFGVDLQEHATAAQAQVHAVYEPADGGGARLVRASVSVPKPDTVVGIGVWQLLRPHSTLLAAYAEGRAVDLDAMPLTDAGDLLWDDARAKAGGPADPFATARVALAGATAAPVPPLDRHPVRLAEPVFLEGYSVSGGEDAMTLSVAGQPIAVDLDRLPPAGPLSAATVAASTACVGLLRWDGGAFAVQPLAVEAPVKKKAVAVHAGAWAGVATDTAGAKAEKAAAESVAVLRERAGRLLRK